MSLSAYLRWSHWLVSVGSQLRRGEWLAVPQWLPSPAEAGFERLALAEDHGQVCDWGLSMRDGARLHVHEHADGRRLLHRDRWDPGAGAMSMLLHGVFETTVGRIAGSVGLLAVVTYVGFRSRSR